MHQIRQLNEEELNELNEWLEEHNVQIDARTRRDFTDVLEVAKIFKPIHSKLIHLSYYVKSNNLAAKLEFWELFNAKVLSKLDIIHSRCALEQLVRAKIGAIESLFYALILAGKSQQPRMRSISQSPTIRHSNSQNRMQRPDKSHSQSLTNIPVETLILNVKEKIDGRIVYIPRKLVAYEDYKKKIRECKKKEIYIEFLSKCTKKLKDFTQANEKEMLQLTKYFGSSND